MDIECVIKWMIVLDLCNIKYCENMFKCENRY
jgi:hypothetical protein